MRVARDVFCMGQTMHSSTWVLIVSLAPVLLGVGMVAGRGCASSRPTTETRQDYVIVTAPAAVAGEPTPTPIDRALYPAPTTTGATITTGADVPPNVDPRTDPRTSFTPTAPAVAPASAPPAMSVDPKTTAAQISAPEAAASPESSSPQASGPVAPTAQAQTASDTPPPWITSGAYVFGSDPNQPADAGAGGGTGGGGFGAESGSLFDAAAGGALLDGATSGSALTDAGRAL